MATTMEYEGYTLTQHGKKWKVWNGQATLCLPLEQAQEVIRKLNDRKREADKLTHVKTITINEILKKYKEWAGTAQQRDPTTLRNVLGTWSYYQSRYQWLHEVTKEAVEKYRDEKPRSNGYTRALIFNTRSILSFATDYGNEYLIDKNVEFVPLPPVDSKPKEEATDEHVKALLSYFDGADWRLRALALAMVTWGCRPATIPELMVSGYRGTYAALYARDAKNKMIAKMIVTPELRPYLDRSAKENGKAGYLFHNSDGTPWNVEGVQAVMKRMHKYKILPPEITWYSFRIRKDNQLIAARVDAYSHALQMGHSMKTIGDTYARLKLEDEINEIHDVEKPIKYTDPGTGIEYAFATVAELQAHLTAAK